MIEFLRRLQAAWPDNKPDGQCAVTALVVQDAFGGSIVRGTYGAGESHYWNRIPGFGDIDLTRAQFAHNWSYPIGVEVPRARLLDGDRADHASTAYRYQMMKLRMYGGTRRTPD